MLPNSLPQRQLFVKTGCRSNKKGDMSLKGLDFPAGEGRRWPGVGKDAGGFSLSWFFSPLKSIIDLSVIAHTPWCYNDVHLDKTTKNMPIFFFFLTCVPFVCRLLEVLWN